jgi:hypothetical protein
VKDLHKKLGLEGLPAVVLEWRDAKLMRPVEPPLAPTYEQWRELKNELDAPLERYVADVTLRGFVASLETSAFLWHLCRARDVSSILDLGSGFTSYVFRRYQAEASHPVEVLSVDHDREWLARTQGFLAAEGMSCDGLTVLEDLPPDGEYSMIYNDIQGALRVDAMRQTAGRTGLIVYDDANRWRDRRALRSIAHTYGFEFGDIRPWTRDFLGRWSLLLTRPES